MLRKILILQLLIERIMRFPCSDTARIIVDGKFNLIVKTGETILNACRNSAIYISANCADGTCRDCVVDIKNQEISEFWSEALACQQISVDGMSKAPIFSKEFMETEVRKVKVIQGSSFQQRSDRTRIGHVDMWRNLQPNNWSRAEVRL